MHNSHFALRLVKLLGALAFLVAWIGIASAPQISLAEPPLPAATAANAVESLYLPMIYVPVEATPTSTPTSTLTPTATATATPTATLPPREWDSRLSQRHAILIEATPSPDQGYWRLVSARWYDEAEAGGRHHILVDVLDAAGQRMVDVPIRIHWDGGETTLLTQAKNGEPYAADFGMFSIAPSYGAAPHTGAATDTMWGMGLGSIELPYHTIHTSYGLVWQWTVSATEPVATPTPSATPPATDTPSATPTPVTPTAIATETATATPGALPTRVWDPRLDQRGVVLSEAQVAPGQGYWRLISGTWYDEAESGGRHHIFVDLRSENGERLVGQPVRIFWNGGETILTSQAKPGEPYAADFGMSSPGPSYGAVPVDGAPADSVWGMGLGSIEQPYYAIPTSYGFVWQWTIQTTAGTTTTRRQTVAHLDSYRLNH